MRRISTACFSLALLALTACSDDGAGKPAKIVLPTFVATGQPLTAPAMTWQWIDFPDTKCRDGSVNGIGVSLNPASSKLMIYLEGGGACFDQVSCTISPPNNNDTGIAQFNAKSPKTAGLWNRTVADNPVKDWNMIYVPYCTGDTHAGDNPDAVLPDLPGEKHQFVGYTNMKKFLNRIVPTFPNVTDVLLTGISAGGFGAAQNALLVQSAFPNLKIKLIDDSGPPLSTDVIPVCLQQKWRDAWALDKTYLKDCGKACENTDNFVQPLAMAMASSFSDRPAGLIESTQDSTIRTFFAAGIDNCTGVALVQSVDPTVFENDLLDYRNLLKDYPQFGTWLPAGTKHTWISQDVVFTAKIGDQRLIDWITRIINGQNPGNYGP